jgi:hypothetical protein
MSFKLLDGGLYLLVNVTAEDVASMTQVSPLAAMPGGPSLLVLQQRPEISGSPGIM